MASGSGPSEDDSLNRGSSAMNPNGAGTLDEPPADKGAKNPHGPGDADTPGGQKAEDVEDRPNVSTVTSEDYPPGLPDH